MVIAFAGETQSLQAVRCLSLCHIGPKETVPDTENCAVVLTKTMCVSCVVNSVKRGRVEDEFNVGKCRHELGMKPKLQIRREEEIV